MLNYDTEDLYPIQEGIDELIELLLEGCTAADSDLAPIRLEDPYYMTTHERLKKLRDKLRDIVEGDRLPYAEHIHIEFMPGKGYTAKLFNAIIAKSEFWYELLGKVQRWQYENNDSSYVWFDDMAPFSLVKMDEPMNWNTGLRA